eukprot:2256577-Prymnesium_polylepis.1
MGDAREAWNEEHGETGRARTRRLKEADLERRDEGGEDEGRLRGPLAVSAHGDLCLWIAWAFPRVREFASATRRRTVVTPS